MHNSIIQTSSRDHYNCSKSRWMLGGEDVMAAASPGLQTQPLSWEQAPSCITASWCNALQVIMGCCRCLGCEMNEYSSGNTTMSIHKHFRTTLPGNNFLDRQFCWTCWIFKKKKKNNIKILIMSLAVKLSFFEFIHMAANVQVLPWLGWLVKFMHKTRTSMFY